MLPPRKKPTKPLDTALRLLARREHSADELKRKLAARGVDTAATEAVLQRLAGHDLQSNARYAEQLIRTRLARGYGPRRIRADLEQAGLDDETIEATFAEAAVDWVEQARAAHAKRFGAVPALPAERQRQYRFLLGRGFEPDQIGAALRGGDE